MADQILDSLADQVLRPLSNGVGEDLAQTSSMELIQIRNQFNDSNRDFRLLYENGRLILSERSKDMWAAWALVGGLLWSKQFEPADSFAASCKIVRGLCEKYWPQLYPESRGLKSTLLSQIAKWWNTFAVRCAEGADPALIQTGVDDLAGLHTFLVGAIEGNTEQDKARIFPVLNVLPQIVRALGKSSDSVPTAAAVASDAPARPAANHKPEPEDSVTDSVAVRPDTLEQAFQKAAERVRAGEVEGALADFQATLRGHGEFASQFRGRVLLGELYLKANLPTHAKRVLQYTHDELDKVRLPDWDPKLCSRLWSSLIQAHQRTKEEKPNEKLLADIFASLCRIDPSTAASLEPVKAAN